jgi:hypothetical protein
MRFIQKPAAPPPSIATFLQNQLPVGVNLDYDQGFGRKEELLHELTAQQYGLCAYTGAPIDDRMANLQPPPSAQSRPRFLAHNEHLKPQSVCKKELIDGGKSLGRDLGDDMDYHNIVAALLVEGSDKEQFGAASRGNQLLPVWPTHPNCETRFMFARDGKIMGVGVDGVTTVDVLRLNHETLTGWWLATFDVFLDPRVIQTREDVEALIARLDQPQNGRLVEYCFCIKNVAKSMLGSVK